MQSRDIDTRGEATPDLAKDKKGLTVTFFVGGKQVENLTDEQKEKMAIKLSKKMSLFYSSQVTEFEKIKE